VSSKESSYRHLESKIKNLERKFKALSRKSCRDGVKGQDGDCNNICSQGYQLTFEDKDNNTGRVACCKPDQVVTPRGACRPKDEDKVPSVCYRLRARLVRAGINLGEASLMFLRGFEGEIDGNIFRCNNDGCCSGNLTIEFADIIRESFKKCGLSLSRPFVFESCLRYAVDGGSDSLTKFNFDIGNVKPYYG